MEAAQNVDAILELGRIGKEKKALPAHHDE